ncbi:hypothetical protein FOZ61_004601 [Perkinsus olseni]|uniref:Uncharacterized protein n=1 Tax=Perkinsus olseni TaxID=32597 RepID=A0A7J6LK60_PEROL|nr:hypothetical protein FOZ61_004601 [Perkinsus olseni]
MVLSSSRLLHPFRVSSRCLHVAKPISPDPTEMMGVISAASRYAPDELLQVLTRVARHDSAQISACRVLARRFGQSAGEYYPTQIVEVTRLFRSIGYADASVWAAVAGRADDVLGTASPKRLVQFLEYVGDLQLPLRDPSIWSVARPSILAVLPHIRGGLGTVMETLAAHGCRDEYIIDALMAQARVLFRGGELSLSIFARVVESYGSLRPEADSFDKNSEVIQGYVSSEEDSPSDWLVLAAAAERVGDEDMQGYCDKQCGGLRGRLETTAHLERMGMVKLGHTAAKVGYRSDKFIEEFENVLEHTITAEPNYIHSRLVFAFAALASLPSTEAVVSILLQSEAVRKAVNSLPVPHLLSLLNAAALAGMPGETEVCESLRRALRVTASSLDLRQRRTLWLSTYNEEEFDYLPIPPPLPARMPWDTDYECEGVGAFQLPIDAEGKLIIFGDFDGYVVSQ